MKDGGGNNVDQERFGTSVTRLDRNPIAGGKYPTYGEPHGSVFGFP